ncbi:serine protease inhibitor serpin [Holotrichia oblita]|uniref:Serine protease inhibitor serpin n=1 Tax=Holotrichia oblita TaxID=644536 RepID=A0ACB9THA9_HOLOL|nr:serine protease inhibitor serpin [Holotrichia oblita]
MTLFVCSVFCFMFISVFCYSDDFTDGYYYHRAFPQDVMVDVINNFGLALLEAHNEGNENNIALSPYGATSVLIALMEGIRGHAAKEIQDATRVPLDISVVRVGLRDIHRHLKSYFIPKEGFLAGLTLSNEKVPLNYRYEQILRFYGYDSQSFNNPLYPDAFTTTPVIDMAYINSTMTTFSTNEVTLGNSDITTSTETLETKESEIDIIELMSTTPNVIEKNTMITTSTDASVSEIVTNSTTDLVVGNLTVAMSTDTTILTTASTQLDTTTAKITTIIPDTTIQIKTSSESTNSSDNTEKITPTTVSESTSTIMTSTEESTSVSLSTETPVTRDVESLTSKNVKPITTTELTSTSLDTTTLQFQDALELADMADDDIIEEMSATSTKLTSYTTLNNDAEMIEITSENVPYSTFSPVNNVVSLNSQTMTTDIAATTENASETPTTAIYSDDVTSTKTTLNLNTTSNENVTEIASTSTVDVTQDESTNISNDTTSAEIIVTTSVTQSISKVTTTFETSSSSISDFVSDQTTTTIETSLSTLSTDDTTFTSEDMSTPTTEETSSSTITTTDIDFSTTFVTNTESSINNSTNTSQIEDVKRGARSIIDYIVARHYDGLLNWRDDYGKSYKPEEKLSFLVHGKYREPNINFMTYDAVLPIAYIPIIDALALSFPLDSKEYYLLLLLPIKNIGIDKLIYGLKRKTSLRSIISSLRYAHVTAIIPSFMLKGYVVLTPTLQKLGIRRIFEPRHTDFSLMTNERDIYVTNVEQAVTVTIRNYVDPQNLPDYSE